VNKLAKLVRFRDDTLRSRMQRSFNNYPLPASDFEALRSLTGIDAGSTAIKSIVLYHCVDSPGWQSGHIGCPWPIGRFPEDIERSFILLPPSVCHRAGIVPYLNRGTALMEVLRKPSSKIPRYPPIPEMPAKRVAILLRKGQHWPLTTPTWCLIILDELELERSEELARRQRAQSMYQAFDFAPWHEETEVPDTLYVSEEDEFLDAWMEDLRQ
jgi:hypothetical protein